MTRGARIVAAAALALTLALPAAAQDSADKTRLDDFSLPTTGASDASIEQLGSAGEAPEPVTVPADRQASVPGPAATDRRPVGQITSRSQGGSSPQLSNRQDSRDIGPGGISSRAESRPQQAAALAGYDRCDPQLQAQQDESCARVLERRAAEFSAAEAPKLSAEQVLLAEGGQRNEGSALTSAQTRLRMASNDDPDADRRSNQELASIYLDRTVPATERAPEQAEGDQAAASLLVQIAEALAGMTSPQAPAN